MSHQAIILFAHGARDARWSRTLGLLASAVQARAPQVHVAQAFLEFQAPTLMEALQTAVAADCTQVDVVPVFWSSAGHVTNDVPPLLDAFRAKHPQIELRVLPALSELPGMMEFIAEAISVVSRKAASE